MTISVHHNIQVYSCKANFRYEGCGNLTFTRIQKIMPDTEMNPFTIGVFQAALLAEKATLKWLKDLREIRGEEEFASYLGLESTDRSLCFVLDVSDSMAAHLPTAIDTMKALMDEAFARDGVLTKVVFSEFNDIGMYAHPSEIFLPLV